MGSNQHQEGRSIAAFIQELNQHIRRQENQMCTDMMDLKKAKTRIIELEEELKFTRDGYETGGSLVQPFTVAS